jgi:hypothetical protein
VEFLSAALLPATEWKGEDKVEVRTRDGIKQAKVITKVSSAAHIQLEATSSARG